MPETLAHIPGDTAEGDPRQQNLPRVLVVGPRLAPPYSGGVEKGIELLLHSDLAAETSMRVFNNYRHHDASRSIWERLGYQGRKMIAFWRELHRIPCDLVHIKTSAGNNFHQNAIYSLLARMAGRPVILQVHTGRFPTFYEEGNFLLRGWIRYTLTRARRVLVLSEFWAQYVAGIAPNAVVEIVPNGLGNAELYAIQSQEGRRRKQVLFVGAGRSDLNRDKGLEDLLAVLPEVAKKHEEARWVLAGIPNPDEVMSQLAVSGVRSQVECHGLVHGAEKNALFKESAVLAFPSHFENMPNLMLEAMAGGMTVVSSDCGAIPDMLGHGEGGIVHAPKNRAALQEALINILSSPELARRHGDRNARVVQQEFTMDRVVEKLRAVYQKVAGDGVGSAPVASDDRTGAGKRPWIFVTWYPYCRRSDSLAEQLGGRSYLIHYLKFKRPWLAPFKYLLQGLKTAEVLIRERPELVLVANPPVVAPLLIWVGSLLLGYRFVIDAHSGAFQHRRWAWSLPGQRFLARRALTTLVTNEFMRQTVQSWGGRSDLIQDISLPLDPEGPALRKHSFHVVFICTYSVDEPVEEVLKAARRLPDVEFSFTGDPAYARRTMRDSLPANVELMGFIPDDDYLALLRGADAILVLTLEDNTMQRGAYEAMALEKPLITSDWPLLREVFSKGTLHVANQASTIVEAIEAVRMDGARMAREMKRLKKERMQISGEQVARLRSLCEAGAMAREKS